METQKTLYIPKFNGVPIENWDATKSFYTDAIEFPYSIPWSFQFYAGSEGWNPGAGTYGVLHSNTPNINDSVIYANIEDVNLSDPQRLAYQAGFFGSRYMFIYYNPGGGETGTFTIQFSK